MNQQDIFNIITRNACEVIPTLAEHSFQAEDSLKDLGANSVDRSEIIMMTLEELSARVPMIEFARAENITDLANIIHAKL
ncbi:polyketide biosynthesis acyl carrier protein [Alteromonadaceae bacterium 2753L.S.0a.02]|nr:polyketide biosynthesis acyl carrier protein [Alteromonadaceae bacterium 2753L.S.0a.02]